MNRIDKIVADSLNKLKREKNIKKSLKENDNLLEIFDSFDLVNLILNLEDDIKKNLKTKIQLADENLFDLKKSPLISLKLWKNYVKDLYEKKK
tara:strand:- start:475 stop:753 length:279 start_codon:yes stop_codon:yes gene_type:complete